MTCEINPKNLAAHVGSQKTEEYRRDGKQRKKITSEFGGGVGGKQTGLSSLSDVCVGV